MAGFSLIELMVGVLIGLMASVVVTQVLLSSESQKRTTTSGSDAQINGALALDALQRAMQPAGYGIAANPSAVGCALEAFYNGAVVPGFPDRLVPVTISPSDPLDLTKPDIIRVLASGKSSYSLPLRIVAPGYNPTNAATRESFLVTSVRTVEGPRTDSAGSALSSGDLMVAVIDQTQPCELFQVTANPAGTPAKVDRADQAAGWNGAGHPSANYGEGAYLINLGTPIDRTFTVSNGSLRVTTLRLAPDTGAPSYEGPVELFPNVVNLKALYGKDTDGNGSVDAWDTVTPTTNAGWRQVLALRVAIVARSAQFEKEDVTTANPLWDVGATVAVAGTVNCGSSKCLSLTVNNLPDWQRYRYKVFDTVIPLRNLLWNS